MILMCDMTLLKLIPRYVHYCQQVNKAWTDACQSKAPAKILIPLGDWLVGELMFTGPCTTPAPITIEVQGILKAKPDIGSFPSGMWISIFQASVHIIGGGLLHGQGEAVWKTKKPGDKAFPDVSLLTKCIRLDTCLFLILSWTKC